MWAEEMTLCREKSALKGGTGDVTAIKTFVDSSVIDRNHTIDMAGLG